MGLSLAQAQSPPDRRFGAVEAFRAPEEASQAGAAWERVVFWWRELQPNGPDDWNVHYFPDGTLQEELGRGREVVGMLSNAPDWANGGQGPPGMPDGLYLPIDDPGNLWATFVRRIVTQYAGRIDRWIIWNEPDVWQPEHPGYTWNGAVEDYYQLLKVAYLTAKEANPNCKIHLAGLTFWWDSDYGRDLYFERLLDVMAQDPTAPQHNYYFDVASVHLYFQSQSAYDMPMHMHLVMQEHGFDKPVWINECNAPPSEDPLDPVGKPRFRIRLEDQANFILQAFALGLAGGAEGISVYKMADKPKPPGALEPYGLLRADDSLRPAFFAYQTAVKYFAGARSAELVRDAPFWDRPVDYVTIDRGERTTTAFWNWGPEERVINIPAIAPQALLVNNQGQVETLTALSDWYYTLTLPPNVCIDPGGCVMAGDVFLLVEEGSVSARGSLLPPTPTLTTNATTNVTTNKTPTPTLTSMPRNTSTPMPTRTSTPTRPPTETPEPAYTFTPSPTPMPTPPAEAPRYLALYLFLITLLGVACFALGLVWVLISRRRRKKGL